MNQIKAMKPYEPQPVILYSEGNMILLEPDIPYQDWLNNVTRQYGHWYIHSPGDFRCGKKAFKRVENRSAANERSNLV